MTKQNKTARLDIRLTPKQHKKLVRVSKKTGMTRTELVIVALELYYQKH